MVTKDDEAATELGPGGGDADVHLLIRKTEVLLGQRLALADVVLFVFGQDVKLHFRERTSSSCETFRKALYQYSRLQASSPEPEA
jgi:hypothetical protein